PMLPDERSVAVLREGQPTYDCSMIVDRRGDRPGSLQRAQIHQLPVLPQHRTHRARALRCAAKYLTVIVDRLGFKNVAIANQTKIGGPALVQQERALIIPPIHQPARYLREAIDRHPWRIINLPRAAAVFISLVSQFCKMINDPKVGYLLIMTQKNVASA